MGSFKIENLSFAYPNREAGVLDEISFTTKQGEFITLCGKSGCGKTTLLRLLKSTIAPFGNISGSIFLDGKPLADYDTKEQASKIGFVMQNPDNQIITDKVWHELAFGLESLGLPTSEIRTKVAEMASFFGIQTWFHKKVTNLSGGQKQLLNLASVMVMQPSVLILDEPTSQLDPIAAQEFLKTLEKINRELGTSVILTEHRLEDTFAISDRILVMDNGNIIADGTPKEVGFILKELNHDMYSALPSPMRIYGTIENGSDFPLSVKDGRQWLEEFAETHTLNPELIPKPISFSDNANTVIEMKDVWFRYEKNLPDIIKGMSLQIKKGELFALMGGNGTGKTTALSLISGLNKPYRGKILIDGTDITNIKNLYNGTLGVLPQNPQSVFVKKTVYLDLLDILSGKKLTSDEKDTQIKEIAQLCRIESLLGYHPYDLSGGEQQRAALAKILLMAPEILLLDEPTKGMDAHFKAEFSCILADLKAKGVTVIMVSHDIEFCAEYADRCALVFDGIITSCGIPREFFPGNNFYTTSANRMARTTLPNAVLPDDIILACDGVVPPKKEPDYKEDKTEPSPQISVKKPKKILFKRIFWGCLFLLLFIATTVFSSLYDGKEIFFQIGEVIEIAAALCCFFPQREFGVDAIQKPQSDRKLSKRTITAAFLILLAIPLTIYLGVNFLGDRKYYFICLMILLETMIPFFMVFENRRPQARELIIISVLCAIAVAGRAAFFMLPQFKPVVAIVIIAGICFGGETGFLVGAVTGFVSNFFFGQGPWAPWQMFAFGIIGFVAGILFRKSLIPKTKLSLCIFGFLSTVLIYGGIINPASVIMWQGNINMDMILASYAMGLPFDLIHATSTAFFLWFIAEPMIDKLERIKIKYGLIER